MKLTSQQLQQIIKEELQAVLGEQEGTPEEAGLDPEQEKKLAAMCLDPDSAESANISADSLGYEGENFCFDMLIKNYKNPRLKRGTTFEENHISLLRRIYQEDIDFNGEWKYYEAGTNTEILTYDEVMQLMTLFGKPKREKIIYPDGSATMYTGAAAPQRAKALILISIFANSVSMKKDSFEGKPGKFDVEYLERNIPQEKRNFT